MAKEDKAVVDEVTVDVFPTEEAEAPPVIPVTPVTGAGARSLVIYESGSVPNGGGRMFALDPAQVGAVPIPAFKTVATNPAAGVIRGEAILNTTSGMSYVWDGNNWASIVPPSIVPYPTDAAIRADRPPAGTYAFSMATGNLFVRFNDGTNDVWREIGISHYPTQAQLLAAVPVDGTLAFAGDSQQYWMYINGEWEAFGIAIGMQADILTWTLSDGAMAYAFDMGIYWGRIAGTWQPLSTYTDTQANILASGYRNGTEAYSTDTHILWQRINGQWVSTSPMVDTQANILARPAPAGQIAISTDSGKIYVGDGGMWRGQPFTDYPTERALLTDNAPVGTMAVAVDTGLVYYRLPAVTATATAPAQPEHWISVNDFSIPSGNNDPANARSSLGDLFYNTTGNTVKIFNGTAWVNISRNRIDQMLDVNFRTPPVDGDVMVYDLASGKWLPKPVKSGAFTGTEPPLVDRFTGMLWWDAGALWIWDAAGVWVQA